MRGGEPGKENLENSILRVKRRIRGDKRVGFHLVNQERVRNLPCGHGRTYQSLHELLGRSACFQVNGSSRVEVRDGEGTRLILKA